LSTPLAGQGSRLSPGAFKIMPERAYNAVMDERKSIIRELENKKKADTGARNRLLEGLGETLLLRIGEGEPFTGNTGDKPGAVLIEYRRLQGEIAKSADAIKSIEQAVQRLKELEEQISGMEEEHFRLEKKLAEVHIELGKALLLRLDSGSVAEPWRQQEEILLARIGEQEKKLEELEEQEGNILSWLGKNAQMAVSKALLIKNRTALQRVYRSTGEKFFSAGPAASDEIQQDPDLDGDAAGIAGEAHELRTLLSSLAEGLIVLKGERRNIMDQYGVRGGPFRRIQGLEKQIAGNRAKLPGVYLNFGSLAAETEGKDAMSSLILAEDRLVLEKADSLKLLIEEKELEIERINAAISIDNEKAEIEKIRKAIAGQRQKITAAEEAIVSLEKQISESEGRIEELETFLNSSAGIREDHGRKNKESDQAGKDSNSAGGEKGHTGKGGSRKSGAGPGGKKAGS